MAHSNGNHGNGKLLQRGEKLVAYFVSFKALEWGKANGYANVIDGLDAFMAEYNKSKEVAPAANYYESQSTERLMEIIEGAHKRLERAKAALNGKFT